ncbi:hypothetical protein N8K70_00675 [Microbacterium betulae]|uniref:NTP pyrophosphohydrolase n=1 Tax=Microbacterium betulae TaxID=2981139 RepID=A0AA97FHP4_9MICO|nr:hypothetical protein [Microbacterium sp. AB]WOF23215.1 hypothetical protein N8K70_00675 [Microbacterium sp. AB]
MDARLSGLSEPPGTEDGEAAPAGRIEVRERVLRKIARTASASAIGIDSGDVTAHVVDHRGGIAVRVRAPLPVPDLADDLAVGNATSVIDRARALQEDLHTRLTQILGRDVKRVEITIDGARVNRKGRVR